MSLYCNTMEEIDSVKWLPADLEVVKNQKDADRICFQLTGHI